MRIQTITLSTFVVIATVMAMENSVRWHPPSNQDTGVSPIDMPIAAPADELAVTAHYQSAQTDSEKSYADRIDLVHHRRARHTVTAIVAIIVAVSAIILAGITFMVVRCVHRRRYEQHETMSNFTSSATANASRAVYPETRSDACKMGETGISSRHWNNRWSTVQHNLVYARGHPSMVVPLEAYPLVTDVNEMKKFNQAAEKGEEQAWWWWLEAPAYQPPSVPERAFSTQITSQCPSEKNDQNHSERENSHTPQAEKK